MPPSYLLMLVTIVVIVFCRVKSYISNGWATKYLVNPDACDTPTVASSVSADLSFTGEWTNIKQAYSQQHKSHHLIMDI